MNICAPRSVRARARERRGGSARARERAVLPHFISANTPLTSLYAFINDGNKGISTRAPNGWVGVLRTGERRAGTGRQTARMRPRRTEPMDELHRLQPSRALAGECRPTDPTHHAAGRQAGRQAETVGCSRAAGRALGRSVGSAAPRRKESAVDRGWAGVGVGVSGPAGAPSEGASARQPLSSLSATPDRTDIRPSERASEWLRLCLCAPHTTDHPQRRCPLARRRGARRKAPPPPRRAAFVCTQGYGMEYPGIYRNTRIYMD